MQFREAYACLLEGASIRVRSWHPKVHLKAIEGEIKAFAEAIFPFNYNLTTMLTGMWATLDDPQTLMDFPLALEALQRGHSIALPDWTGSYLKIDNREICLIRMEETNFIPTYQCLTSNDWEILK